MGWFDFLKGAADAGDAEVSSIYPLPLKQDDFVTAEVRTTYAKILSDTLERTSGIPDKVKPLLWDNCVQSESTDGLVSLLSKAMAGKCDLFLVYKPSLSVLREATFDEAQQIRKDYKDNGESKNGVYISFKNYSRTDMMLVYAGLEFAILSSLHKTVNISKAVQLKMKDMRSSTSLADAGLPVAQARAIAAALRNGNDVMIDAEDSIETSTPDTSPTEKAIAFLDAKRAYILGLPLAYISGLQTGGIGATGEADQRAIERGLRQYFVSIIQPVMKAVFDAEVTFKTQDFRQVTSALEALKTFELVSDDLISLSSKRDIAARLLDLDPEAELEKIETEEKERDAEAKANPPPAPTPPDPKPVPPQPDPQAGAA